MWRENFCFGFWEEFLKTRVWELGVGSGVWGGGEGGHGRENDEILTFWGDFPICLGIVLEWCGDGLGAI